MKSQKSKIVKAYQDEQQLRNRLRARGYKNAYTMSSEEVFRMFRGEEQAKQQKNSEAYKKRKAIESQTSLDEFEKAGGAAFNPVNPRTVSACKRYYEAGIAGAECKMVLQQAEQYERMYGRNIFGLDTQKISVYSVLPKIQFGMTERNIIFIKNWNALMPHEKQILTPFFDQRGVAWPGKSGAFIKDQLPKGRQEKRMFEVFNIIHGLNIEVTPEGYVLIPDYQDLDTNVKDLLEFYFTQDGYAKMYFQNGFLSRLGLKLREHVPSKITSREGLLKNIRILGEKQHSSEECKQIINKKNPSLVTNINEMHPTMANTILDRYILYTKMSSFLNEDLMLIGTTGFADEKFNLTERFETESNAVSVTFYNGIEVGIAIADQYTQDMEMVQEFLMKSRKQGWTPPGCEKIDYISAHEFAHALTHVYDLSRDPIIREIETDLLEDGLVAKEVGLHARMNTKEFVADCWSEYVLSDSPRETATKVGDRMLSFLQKKVIVL